MTKPIQYQKALSEFNDLYRRIDKDFEGEKSPIQEHFLTQGVVHPSVKDKLNANELSVSLQFASWKRANLQSDTRAYVNPLQHYYEEVDNNVAEKSKLAEIGKVISEKIHGKETQMNKLEFIAACLLTLGIIGFFVTTPLLVLEIIPQAYVLTTSIIGSIFYGTGLTGAGLLHIVEDMQKKLGKNAYGTDFFSKNQYFKAEKIRIQGKEIELSYRVHAKLELANNLSYRNFLQNMSAKNDNFMFTVEQASDPRLYHIFQGYTATIDSALHLQKSA